MTDRGNYEDRHTPDTGVQQSQPMMTGLPGPCVICGGTNYDLSCGGPTICPKCDCGQFDAATVMTQSKALASMRAKVDELTAALEHLVAKLNLIHAHPRFKLVWEVAQFRVGPYDGPTYTEELDAAEATLAALAVNSQHSDGEAGR